MASRSVVVVVHRTLLVGAIVGPDKSLCKSVSYPREPAHYTRVCGKVGGTISAVRSRALMLIISRVDDSSGIGASEGTSSTSP